MFSLALVTGGSQRSTAGLLERSESRHLFEAVYGRSEDAELVTKRVLLERVSRLLGPPLAFVADTPADEAAALCAGVQFVEFPPWSESQGHRWLPEDHAAWKWLFKQLCL